MVINVFTNFTNAVNTSIFGRVSHNGQGEGDWGIGLCLHVPPHCFGPKMPVLQFWGNPVWVSEKLGF